MSLAADLADRSFPVVLAGPSGSGKTTVARAAADGSESLRFSISVTTRPPRPEERDEEDYRFVDREKFRDLIEEGELLEWARVHGEWYGTPRSNLRRARADGRHLLLDIDVQGARAVRRLACDAVSVFLLPPTGERIVRRLRGRGSESESEVRARLAAAEEEIDAIGEFDHVLVNEDVAATADLLRSVVRAEERRIQRLGDHVQKSVSGLVEEIRGALQANENEDDPTHARAGAPGPRGRGSG